MFSSYNFRSYDCLSILSWVLYRERHYGFRTIYWRGCLFSNVFLAPLLRGCSCKAFSDSGFHTVLYWPTYQVLCFYYYGSYSSLKSGIVVPIVLFFLLFFPFEITFLVLVRKSWYFDEGWIESVSLIILNCLMHEHGRYLQFLFYNFHCKIMLVLYLNFSGSQNFHW